jgi:hypothetical protein
LQDQQGRVGPNHFKPGTRRPQGRAGFFGVPMKRLRILENIEYQRPENEISRFLCPGMESFLQAISA